MLASRWFRWAGPLAVVLLATVLRLWNLGNPHSLVFDETFYVKDAWSLWNNGYESTWLANADTLFNAGQTNAFATEGSFVVHPPLGKWLIALGMAAFGAHHSWAWRIVTALIGILAVVLLMVIAKKLFGSTLLATIAGFLFAIDGNAIVMSRVAILDNSVMFFALLGFAAVLMDRGWHEKRLAAWLTRRRSSGSEPSWGPTFWWRPWVIAAGIAFGMASSVKWSGFYFLAAFGIYLVVVDALARRRAGLPFWLSAAVLKQAPATFLLVVPVALTTLLVSWTGWFVTQGGYYRQYADAAGAAWTGPFSWVPHVWQSFWHYQVAIYQYHVSLSTPHPYQANPLTWLLMTRPTSMFYEGTTLAQNGCASASCSQAILGVANPLIWWAAGAAILYLVYRLARYRQWQVGLILMGMVAGYLPWMAYLNRTVFQFYTIAFEPYMLLGLTFVIGMLLRDPPMFRPLPADLPADSTADSTADPAADPAADLRDALRDESERAETARRTVGIRVVVIFLSAALLVSAFFYPLWAGIQTPLWFWQLHMWLPSWV